MELIFSLKNNLSIIRDPRIEGRTLHLLIDIIVLTVLAYISGAETWTDVESFGESKHEWLKKFLKLSGGIPSHDTISRVFSLIEPREFEVAFISWVNEVRKKNNVSDVICLDGKVCRGTYKKTKNYYQLLNVLNIYSTETGLVLGQLKAKGRGNAEASAAREALDLINVKDMLVVMDAGIGKKSVAEKIIKKGGDYIFPLKKNSRPIYYKVEKIFKNIAEKNSKSSKFETYSAHEAGHGRVEKRHYTIMRNNFFPKDLNVSEHSDEQFPSLSIIGRVVYERETKQEKVPVTKTEVIAGKKVTKYVTPEGPTRKSKEVRYFITSSDAEITTIAERLRKQWFIENKLHWVLDVGLNEDGNRTRNMIAAENAATVRKIVFNLMKQDPNKKIGIKRKIKKASWDVDYLETILFTKKLS